MDLDTWVNIVLVVVAVIALYVARKNEKAAELRKAERAERREAAEAAKATNAPVTSMHSAQAAAEQTPPQTPSQQQQKEQREVQQEQQQEVEQKQPPVKRQPSLGTQISSGVTRVPKWGEREESDKPKQTYRIGTTITVLVDSIHFTTHRCKVRGTNPTMAQMMKFSEEKLRSMGMKAARWHFGDFSCWAVDGQESNRWRSRIRRSPSQSRPKSQEEKSTRRRKAPTSRRFN